LMVTSAVAGEGKSTTAVNLALSMAKKGVKVILVDGDLRHPSVAPILGIESEFGIADILRGDVKTTEVLKAAGEDGLLVIPGTKPVKNPTELISSENMQRLIYQLKKAADYVIIDTPPCTVMSDASVFARMTQGIVMVVRQDFARIEKVVSGFEILVETGTPLIGYILDGTAVGITGYGHGYGYGYGKYGYGKYGYGKYGYGKYGYGKYGYGYGADQEKREKKQETEKKDTKNGHTDSTDKKKEET
ncbi:MAG: CpsD/CapB family tyrosine-protein kinase, partial [Clostridiales bacterium]|nr:CpsD/CapB family tyrosine-protein kinase [Clostridiales bacterium]